MDREREFDFDHESAINEQALIQDLGLNILFEAMAGEDKFLADVAKKAVLRGETNPEAILYRQDILLDALHNSTVVKSIYDIAVEAVEGEKRNNWLFSWKHPGLILKRSIHVLQTFAGELKRLRKIAEQHAGKFGSNGWSRLFEMLKSECNDEYLAALEKQLTDLKFSDGLLISAELEEGNKGAKYIPRKPNEAAPSWMSRLFGPKVQSYTFQVHPRDESGSNALAELRDRGINAVANSLAQSADHMLGFFRSLRAEVAFYIGCTNLRDRLAQRGSPICWPSVLDAGQRAHVFTGLYDICLALSLEQGVVGNEADTGKKQLIIITGANRGGKSTFLRSIGLAQLMMQCGMFVPAQAFCANVCESLFTHFKREEDVAMKSGKLDEELARMSDIVSHLRPNAMVLFNESFAATNEREGSEIARQIVRALLESRIKLFFVTHLYEFAHSFYETRAELALFLRAERGLDGSRSFKLIEGEPEQTSYGRDLYQKIFNSGQVDTV